MVEVKYLLPSSNCSITLRSGRRIVAVDGIIAVDAAKDAALASEMEDMLQVGNCTIYDGGPVLAKQAPVQLGTNGLPLGVTR